MASLGIDYWVLSSDYLDDIKKVQAKFDFSKVGQAPFKNSSGEALSNDFTHAKTQLRERLKDRRNEVKGFSDSSPPGSEFGTSANSFLIPLDER